MFAYELSGCGFESSCSHLKCSQLGHKVPNISEHVHQQLIKIDNRKPNNFYDIFLSTNNIKSFF